MQSENKRYVDSAEYINKRTLDAQHMIKEGGREAIKAHFELNEIAAKAENFKEEAEEENSKHYDKKTDDIKKLIEIDNKNKLQEPLSRDELIFLYEINTPFEGFTKYNNNQLLDRCPKIQEIIDDRNTLEDAPIVFGCQPEEIAHSREMINENTEAYIGPLFPGIFSYNFEYIYTSFPEGRIEKIEMTIGGKPKEVIMHELQWRAESSEPEEKIRFQDKAKSMMDNSEFYTLEKSKQIDLVKLKVSDLGLTGKVTYDEICKRAEELGLELCLPEVGPSFRLNHKDIFEQKQVRRLGQTIIGMRPIIDSSGNPEVFKIFHTDLLGITAAGIANGFDSNEPQEYFLFCASKIEALGGLNHNEIASKLIESSQGEYVAQNLEKFEGLNDDIALKLIEDGYGKFVAKNLKSFVGLDKKTILTISNFVENNK